MITSVFETSEAPTVDVIVRTKDRIELLTRALRDIRAQSYPNWQITVVNDGGELEAVRSAIAAAGLGNDERLVLIHVEQSLGRPAAANLGITWNLQAYPAAHLVTSAQRHFGDLVVIHDDDDTWHPEFLEHAVRYLAQHAEAPAAVSRIEIVYEQLDAAGGYSELRREAFEPQLPAPLLDDLLVINRIIPIGFVSRRSIHDEIGYYNEALLAVEDWDFYLRVLSRWPLDYLGDTPLAYWHQRPSADGVLANSVNGESSAHRYHDRRVREHALRQRIAQDQNLGEMLHMTRFVDVRIHDVHRQIDGLREDVVALREELVRTRDLVDERSSVIVSIVRLNPFHFVRAVYRRLLGAHS
jgi:glycosyltransferase involved in cell wall biosynthesis